MLVDLHRILPSMWFFSFFAIFSFLKKLLSIVLASLASFGALRNTMVTSDLRPEVEMWPFCKRNEKYSI